MMTNSREWPAGMLCISFMGLGYVVRRPTTYQNLIATAASLFQVRSDDTDKELYVKTEDFGLEWPVEVLPEVWEIPDVQGFLRTVEFHTRTREAGPSPLGFASSDGTRATTPLSPSSTPPRDIPGRAITHSSTPVNRRARACQPADDEPVSVGYQGHSEDEEAERLEPESSRRVRSRVSLQARRTNDNPRPIRAIKLEPTNEEITPSSSQETDITTDTKTKVVVRHEDTNVTAFISARNTLGSLFKRACKHFELDRATVKLFQMVTFDGRDSMSPIECNLAASLGEANVTNEDIFILLPYDGGD